MASFQPAGEALEAERPRLMPRSVMIVEDDPPTRRRIEAAVAAVDDLAVVLSTGSMREAEAALPGHRPDVLLVDLGLPDGNGVDLIRAARRTSPQTRAMVITVFADEQHVVEAIEAGAQGYLLKDGTAEYIGRSIDELLTGGSPISAPIARYLLQRFQAAAEPAAPREDASRLTARELEILRLVAKGFRLSEVGDLLGIAHRTVTTHIQHIYKKLAVSSQTEAVFEAVHLGLIDLKN